MKPNRKHPLPPPSDATREVLRLWQQVANQSRLPDSVLRALVHEARADSRHADVRAVWSQGRIGTAQLIQAGCLMTDDINLSPRARKYRPAPDADGRLAQAIAAVRKAEEINQNPSRYFEIQSDETGFRPRRPQSKMAEVIGGQHGA